MNNQKYKIINNQMSRYYNEVSEIISTHFQNEKHDNLSKKYLILSFVTIFPALATTLQILKLIDGLVLNKELFFWNDFREFIPIFLTLFLGFLTYKIALKPLWKVLDSRYTKAQYKQKLFLIKKEMMTLGSDDIYKSIEQLLTEIKNIEEKMASYKQFIIGGLISINVTAILTPFLTIITRNEIPVEQAWAIITTIIALTIVVSFLLIGYYFFGSVEPAFGRTLASIEVANCLKDILYYREVLDSHCNKNQPQSTKEDLLGVHLKNNISFYGDENKNISSIENAEIRKGSVMVEKGIFDGFEDITKYSAMKNRIFYRFKNRDLLIVNILFGLYSHEVSNGYKHLKIFWGLIESKYLFTR